jgi:4-diphosphocytidyl-2-C-methyl-D-erythritol kinase
MTGGATTTKLTAFAPGKINLCLFLGPTRADDRHELVTVFESLSLADELTYEPAERTEVSCPGVEGPNLAAAALDAYGGESARITIVKHVPVAAGMGGGSADAAAALRLAAHAAGRPDDPKLAELATGLGADVPSQLRPGVTLGTGAGDVVEPAAARADHGVLIVPSTATLATPAVYAEADRLGLSRSREELVAKLTAVREALAAGPDWPAELTVNDLEPAARSLCPAIGETLQAILAAGADRAFVAGSGPTVVGWFDGAEGAGAAAEAAASLQGRFPGAAAAIPVDAAFAAVRELP